MTKIIMILFSVFIAIPGFTYDKIIVGIIESPPYSEETKTGAKGMVCELLTAAFHATGHDLIYEFYPLARLFDTLIDGKVTCISLGISPEEEAQVIKSKPIYLNEMVLFYKKNKFPDGVNFKDLSELKGHTLGIKNGSTPTIKLLTEKGLIVDLRQYNGTGVYKTKYGAD